MAAADNMDVRLDDNGLEYENQERLFMEFLHKNSEKWMGIIESQMAKKQYRIPLQLSDLWAHDKDLHLDRKVIEAPVKHLLPWEDALFKFLSENNPKAAQSLTHPLKLEINGSFGRNHVTPRGMNSSMLHQLICVEGIVTKCNIAAPKLLQSIHVHKFENDGYVEQRDHRDLTSLVSTESRGGMPTHDSEGRDLKMEIGLSVYKDTQKFTIQEAPENSPPGQIPRSVEVISEMSLVDKAKPGDRVQVIGVYRTFPGAVQEFTTGVFPDRLVATSVTPIKDLIEAPFVPEDVRNIRAIAERPDVFELLARSFAPAICGHNKVKEGLLLQMIGGTEKNLKNGTHLRGDINVLLVGDPSCGKSQMLRFVMNTAPLAVSTTGRGSSGVGLTAAMVREPGSSEFTLEAGAMVLADRGFICIDEFDKMGQGDRVAIHEAMEQQCITIAKAGMHVTLNARCSVVAAANPIYGHFDDSLDLAKNIGLPDSLLSRFDLIFIVRDLTTEELDRKIADQVLRQAMFRHTNENRRGVEEVHSSILERRQEQDKKRHQEASKVFEDSLPTTKEGEETKQVVTVDFLRKYLRYCRRFTPVLSESAQIMISEKYTDMRMRFQSGFLDTQQDAGSKKPRLAVTTRTLEALIRLATAHAKLKLRTDEVLDEDVEQAYRLMLSAREEEVVDRPSEKPAEPPLDEAAEESQRPRRRAQKRPREEAIEDPAEEPAGIIQPGRLTILQTLVARVFGQTRREDIPRAELFDLVNNGLAPGEPSFLGDEFDAGLQGLEALNKVMVAEDLVMFVS